MEPRRPEFGLREFRLARHLLPVAVAAEHGFGTTNLAEIDFAMDGLVLPVAEFDSAQTDPPQVIDQLRRTASEQALFYRENRDRLLDAHAGQYIFLQDGEVIWSGTDPQPDQCRK